MSNYNARTFLYMRCTVCRECFHGKVAASLEPSEGQHSNPLANTKGRHKISRSAPQVLKQSEMHMVSSPFNCSVDNAPSDVQIELVDLQSGLLQASLTEGLLLLPQRGELSTPEKACLEDFGSLRIRLCL
ncbi:unnamed protein product [Lepeophtheirus salmonis]|uniref:(salmon louse) hypothetical protein n=1 Tax=Lepeophtheirus salmonis TaxID=72036 RepID=A0A7R8H1P6_LEPSM|nr:unnamed protein product [Lepeophtheirus salmonis]CAF2797904.1 unnamed protein product [Lepeophtheirus salmonis]